MNIVSIAFYYFSINTYRYWLDLYLCFQFSYYYHAVFTFSLQQIYNIKNAFPNLYSGIIKFLLSAFNDFSCTGAFVIRITGSVISTSGICIYF